MSTVEPLAPQSSAYTRNNQRTVNNGISLCVCSLLVRLVDNRDVMYPTSSHAELYFQQIFLIFVLVTTFISRCFLSLWSRFSVLISKYV